MTNFRFMGRVQLYQKRVARNGVRSPAAWKASGMRLPAACERSQSCATIRPCPAPARDPANAPAAHSRTPGLFPYAPTIHETVSSEVISHYLGRLCLENDVRKPLQASPPDAPTTLEVKSPRTRGRRSFSAAEKLRILSAADACVVSESRMSSVVAEEISESRMSSVVCQCCL